MEYKECQSCGDKEQASLVTNDGNCIPCQKVIEADEDDEIPLEAVIKLSKLATTRHPTACNEVAPRFRQHLITNGFLPSIE